LTKIARPQIFVALGITVKILPGSRTNLAIRYYQGSPSHIHTNISLVRMRVTKRDRLHRIPPATHTCPHFRPYVLAIVLTTAALSRRQLTGWPRSPTNGSEKEKEKVNLPSSLDRAFATAFSLNSVNPNVAATALASAQVQVPPVASGSAPRLQRVMCAVFK
jgi:hypothetical protein